MGHIVFSDPSSKEKFTLPKNLSFELARQLIEVGYHGIGEILNKRPLDKRKKL